MKMILHILPQLRSHYLCQLKLENLLRLTNESAIGACAEISAGEEHLLEKNSRRIFLVKFSNRTKG